MIVTRRSFDEAVSWLRDEPELSVDTETFGLRVFHGDRLFSIIIATETAAFYFNFKHYVDLDSDYVLTEAHLKLLGLHVLESKPDRLWYLMNATFDLHMLAAEGLSLLGEIHDLKVGARLLYSDHYSYSLGSVAEREGLSKSDAADDWIKAHKCYSWEKPPGKKTRVKKPHYDMIPFGIISTYGEQDARITFDLGRRQRREIVAVDEAQAGTGLPAVADVYRTERQLTRTVFHVEQRGILVDLPYCEEAQRHEEQRIEAAEADWRALTGEAFVDSSLVFRRLLPPSPKRTKATATYMDGQASYDSDALEIMAADDIPHAKVILEHRDAKKRLQFFQGFLYHADSQGLVHTNLDQAGTRTGRFSSSSPNLQQLSKEETPGEFPVRRALVPRPGFFFAMLDFEQQEFRMLLDYAAAFTADRSLIKLVLSGLDVHTATGNRAGLERSLAKTVNFSVIYGVGLDLLAARLKRSRQDAAKIKAALFQSSPEIEILMKQAQRVAERRGFVVTWHGRRWHCKDPRFAYRATNALIQGGCADVGKIAMNRVEDYLADKLSRLVLMVHDELVIEVHESERFVVEGCRAIMESVYPAKYLPLTVGADYSTRSLADKEEWAP